MSANLLRLACLAGAGLFAYLSLIPGGLVIASLDPACSGPRCGYSAVGDVFLVITYAASFAALLGSAACFALLALRPASRAAIARLVRSLGITAVALGAAMLAILAVAAPFLALALVLVGGVLFTVLWRHRAERQRSDAASGDGAAPGAQRNGHGPRLRRLPRV